MYLLQFIFTEKNGTHADESGIRVRQNVQMNPSGSVFITTTWMLKGLCQGQPSYFPSIDACIEQLLADNNPVVRLLRHFWRKLEELNGTTVIWDWQQPLAFHLRTKFLDVPNPVTVMLDPTEVFSAPEREYSFDQEALLVKVAARELQIALSYLQCTTDTPKPAPEHKDVLRAVIATLRGAGMLLPISLPTGTTRLETMSGIIEEILGELCAEQ